MRRASRHLVVACALLWPAEPLQAQEIPRFPTLDPATRVETLAPHEDDELDDVEDPAGLGDDASELARISAESEARDTDLALEAKQVRRILDRHTPRSRWEKAWMIIVIMAAIVAALFAWLIRSLRGGSD